MVVQLVYCAIILYSMCAQVQVVLSLELGQRGILYLRRFVCNCERRFKGWLHTESLSKILVKEKMKKS